MRGLTPILAATLFVTATLAGCASSSDTPSSSDAPGVVVKATETTGVIKGVVVDSGIRPIAKAVVIVKAAGKTLTNATNAVGGFGFSNLDPGTYFVSASKAGFVTGQSSVEVKANDDNPPSLRLTLEADKSFVRPYADLVKYNGFLACGVSIVVGTVNACSAPNIVAPGTIDDRFRTIVTMAAVPRFVQNELTWKDNQPAPQRFNLASGSITTTGMVVAINQTQGASPIIEPIHIKAIKASNLGDGADLRLSVFANGAEATVICDPTNSNFGGLLIQNCTYGSGATFEQPFEIYTTTFYGFDPVPGWTFLHDGAPKPPQ